MLFVLLLSSIYSFIKEQLNSTLAESSYILSLAVVFISLLQVNICSTELRKNISHHPSTVQIQVHKYCQARSKSLDVY